jgi:hypothetical protein
MIAVFVTFRYGDDFNETKLAKIAETAQAKFQGMAGLRLKAFMIRADQREATNVYVWDNEAAAKAFFTPEAAESVTQLYGARPTIEFATLAALVDNDRT